MNSKLIWKFVLIFVVMLVLAGNVSGIGIAPGSTTVDFESGLERTVNFKVINNENKDMKVFFNVEGELAPYVTLSNLLVDFAAGEESKQFSYTVELPKKLKKPGTHIAKIIAIDLPPDADSEGTYVGARVGVVSRLEVKVPYPGKYAEAKLRISEGQPGEDAVFVVKVYNYGAQKINKAEATIDILGPTNERIATIISDTKSIDAKGMRELKAVWRPENPGLYHAVATVRYDGKIARAEENFYVGDVFIELLNIDVKNFRLGGVAKFEMEVESKWNDVLKNVFAEIEMRNQNGDAVGNFKSTSTDLDVLAKEIIIAYWDTENIEPGQYDATITLNYNDGEKTQKEFKADVALDGISISFAGATARVVGSDAGEGIFGSGIIALLVIVLILINVGWFIYFVRRKKKK